MKDLSFQDDSLSVYNLTTEEGQIIADFLAHNTFDPFTGVDIFENFINVSSRLVRFLPIQLIDRLMEFRRYGNQDGIYLIRNFPIDEKKIGCTPKHWLQSMQEKEDFSTEMYLLGITSILGESFSFNTQHTGNIIQNIVPLMSDRFEQVGTGSKVFLEWHTEDAFHDFSADFIGLLCLRSDPSAATTFSSIRNMDVPDQYKKLLFQKKYYAGIDKAHGGSGRAEDGVPIAILEGNYEDPSLRVDTSCIAAVDPESEEALNYLINQMNYAACQVVLQQGDLLIMDNRKVVHGRTAFDPKYDGTDRWLQRVSITTDFRKSAALRSKNSRVIEMNISRSKRASLFQ